MQTNRTPSAAQRRVGVSRHEHPGDACHSEFCRILVPAGRQKRRRPSRAPSTASSKPQSFEFANSRVRISADIKTIRKTVRNVIASVRGSDSRLRNEWIVIGAHYDHLGLGDAKHVMSPAEVGKIHHGADDNASGTAGVLELGRLFGRNKEAFKRSVLLMAFCRRGTGIVRLESLREQSDGSTCFDQCHDQYGHDRPTYRRRGAGANQAAECGRSGTSPGFPAWIEEANKSSRIEPCSLQRRTRRKRPCLVQRKADSNAVFLFGTAFGLSPSNRHGGQDRCERAQFRCFLLVAGTAELIANAPAKLLYTEVKDGSPANGRRWR